jgi:hypothetical protein
VNIRLIQYVKYVVAGRCLDEHSSEQMFFLFNGQLDVVFESMDQSVTYMYVMRDVGILFEYVTKTSECRVDMLAG